MQPHSAAVITSFVYLLNHQDVKKAIDVMVEYSNQRKNYHIELVSQYSDNLTLRVAGFWTCSVTIRYQGHRAWTVHDNETRIRETFDFYPKAILNGQIENSEKYKWFKGEISDGGKRVAFEGEYKGVPTRYTVYVR